MYLYRYLFYLSVLLPLTLAGRSALIVIDVQYDFIQGGSLPVPGGDTVSADINTLRNKHHFDEVFLSQDWHCDNHVSFASQHKGYKPNDIIQLQYDGDGNLCRSKNVTNDFAVNCTEVSLELGQHLWPDHCVKDTSGANFHQDLVVKDTDLVVQKGHRCHVDSYSAFFDNGDLAQTELHSKLQQHNISRVYFVGLATDYCVSWSAMDAKKLGYESYVVMDACRNITQKGALKAVEQMREKGVIIIHSDQLSVTHFSNSAHGSLYSLPHTLLVTVLIACLYSLTRCHI